MECPQCKNPLSVENSSVCEWCGNQLPIPEESFFSKIKRLFSSLINKLKTNKKRLYIVFISISVILLFLILRNNLDWKHWLTEKAIDSETKTPIGDDFALSVDDEFGPSIIPAKEPEPESFVDEEAEFPGGTPAMTAFIKKNLVFPETGIENDVRGICFLRFVVSVNGTISSVQVTKGVPDCPDCDKAAIKVIQSMPNWKPGKLNGGIVSSYHSIPIKFSIE